MLPPQSSSDSADQSSGSRLDSSGLISGHFLDSTPINQGLSGGLHAPQGSDILQERSRQLQAKMLDLTDSAVAAALLFTQNNVMNPDAISGHVSYDGADGDWLGSRHNNAPIEGLHSRSWDALCPSQNNDRSPLVGIDQSETDTLLSNTSNGFSTSDPIELLTARVSSLEQKMRSIASQRPIIIGNVETMHSNPGGISQSISGNNNSIYSRPD
jgi:hypothetical protein